MSRNIFVAIFGLGMAGLAFATPTCAEVGSDISREELGMIPGTIAHLKDVKLRAVSKLPAD